jgi:hypothetical protein
MRAPRSSGDLSFWISRLSIFVLVVIENCTICLITYNCNTQVNSDQFGIEMDEKLENAVTEPLFFTVSPLKFAVMSLVTLGFYELYWLYKNWKIINDSRNLSLKPFWRAFFAYFYIYPLLDLIRKSGNEHGYPSTLKAGPLAAAWIIISLTWKLPDPLSFISMFAFIALLPVVQDIVRLTKATNPEAEINSKFSVANWVGIVIGGVVFVFGLCRDIPSEYSVTLLDKATARLSRSHKS